MSLAYLGGSKLVPGSGRVTDAKFYRFREKILYRMEISNDLHLKLDYSCDQKASIRAAGARPDASLDVLKAAICPGEMA